jgi:hypothetical protein
MQNEIKSDQQSFSQPHEHFIENLMGVAEKPPRKHGENLRNLSLRIDGSKTRQASTYKNFTPIENHKISTRRPTQSHVKTATANRNGEDATDEEHHQRSTERQTPGRARTLMHATKSRAGATAADKISQRDLRYKTSTEKQIVDSVLAGSSTRPTGRANLL